MARMMMLLISIGLLSTTIQASPNKPTPEHSNTLKQAFNSYYHFELLNQLAKKCNKPDFLDKIDLQALDKQLLRATKLNTEQFYLYVLNVSYNIEKIHKQKKAFSCNNKAHLGHIPTLVQRYLNAHSKLSRSAALPKPLTELNYSLGVLKSLEDRALQQRLLNNFAKADTVALGFLLETQSVPQSHFNVYLKYTPKTDYIYRLDSGWKDKIAHYLPTSGYFRLNSSNTGKSKLFFISIPKNAFRTFEIIDEIDYDDIKPLLFLFPEKDWRW